MTGRLKVLLSLPEYIIFVAEADGDIVGLVGAYMAYSLEFSGMYGRLITLIVDERHRGAGIGKQLIAEIESRLKREGALLAVVTSSSHREESHRFYEDNGYLNTGIRFTKKL
jgi:GNAT superfamily N-acetyltransferase